MLLLETFTGISVSVYVNQVKCFQYLFGFSDFNCVAEKYKTE